MGSLAALGIMLYQKRRAKAEKLEREAQRVMMEEQKVQERTVVRHTRASPTLEVDIPYPQPAFTIPTFSGRAGASGPV
jgi:hypothetical protein